MLDKIEMESTFFESNVQNILFHDMLLFYQDFYCSFLSHTATFFRSEKILLAYELSVFFVFEIFDTINSSVYSILFSKTILLIRKLRKDILLQNSVQFLIMVAPFSSFLLLLE